MSLEKLYKRWLEKGYDAQLFYEYSLQEVIDRLDAYERNKLVELKTEIVQFDTLAKQIGEQIAAILSTEPITLTPLYEWYPALFEKPVETESGMTPEMQLHKAQMENFAHYHNAARKKRGDD